MYIKSTITETDFVNATFALLYSKTSTKVLIGILLLFLVLSIVTAVLLPEASWSQAIVPLAVLTGLFLITFFGAKRNFALNKRMGEAIEYHFDNDYLLMKGQSFNFELSWNKVYKVTKTKNWILIWQNNQIATPIPRRDIDEELITHLRGTLNGHKVKNNL